MVQSLRNSEIPRATARREGWQNGYCTGLENRRPQGHQGSNPWPSVYADKQTGPALIPAGACSVRCRLALFPLGRPAFMAVTIFHAGARGGRIVRQSPVPRAASTAFGTACAKRCSQNNRNPVHAPMPDSLWTSPRPRVPARAFLTMRQASQISVTLTDNNKTVAVLCGPRASA